MYKINKLQHGKGFFKGFSHSLVKYQKSHSFAAITRSISDTSPIRVKIPCARAFHEVISQSILLLTFCVHDRMRKKTPPPGGIMWKIWSKQALAWQKCALSYFWKHSNTATFSQSLDIFTFYSWWTQGVEMRRILNQANQIPHFSLLYIFNDKVRIWNYLPKLQFNLHVISL